MLLVATYTSARLHKSQIHRSRSFASETAERPFHANVGVCRACSRERDKDIVHIARYYATGAMDDAPRAVTAFIIAPHGKFERSRAHICSRKRRYPLTRAALTVRSDYQRIIPANDAL